MNLLLVFHYSLYTLAGAAGLLLSISEWSPFPALLTPPLAVAAYWFTEKRRSFYLNAVATNVLAVAAIGAAGVEFFQPSMEVKLLSVAHLLVYVSWIILFQEKRLNSYWWLMALAILQVAISSVLTVSPWYGVGLFAFLALGLWTLYVFSLYRAALRFTPRMVGVVPEQRSVSVGKTATESASMLLTLPSSQAFDSVQQESAELWLNMRGMYVMLQISLQGLLLGVALFLLIPRLWQGPLNPLATRGLPAATMLTGFSDTVQLGRLGEMLQNNSRVMQVWMYDGNQPDPLEPDVYAHRCGLPEPLFRGTVLTRYSKGAWSTGLDQNDERSQRQLPRQKNDATLRQRIILQPIATNTIFAMRHISAGKIGDTSQEPLLYNTETGALSWLRPLAPRPVQYTIFSQPVTDDRIVDYGRLPQVLLSSRRTALLQLPLADVPRLVALARRVAAGEPGAEFPTDATPDRRKALMLEAFLRDNPEFSYSLKNEVIDPKIDPIEDFLFNRRSGHCEYYATALALMLRAVNIPSRVVNGFKGGRHDGLTGAFEIEQRHAHSWVEAYVRTPDDDHEWIVLDATPGARNQTLPSYGTRVGMVESAFNYVSSVWSNYVVSISIEQQKQAFYDPLQRGSESMSLSSANIQRQWNRLVAWLYSLAVTPSLWLTWQGLSTAATFVVGGFLTWYLAKRLIQRSRKSREGAGSSRARPRKPIEFYDHYLSVLGHAGFVPLRSQTAVEFAQVVQAQLSRSAENVEVAAIPAEVATAFTRVRYGDETLEKPALQKIETDVQKLEKQILGNDRLVARYIERVWRRILRSLRNRDTIA